MGFEWNKPKLKKEEIQWPEEQFDLLEKSIDTFAGAFRYMSSDGYEPRIKFDKDWRQICYTEGVRGPTKGIQIELEPEESEDPYQFNLSTQLCEMDADYICCSITGSAMFSPYIIAHHLDLILEEHLPKKPWKVVPKWYATNEDIRLADAIDKIPNASELIKGIILARPQIFADTKLEVYKRDYVDMIGLRHSLGTYKDAVGLDIIPSNDIFISTTIMSPSHFNLVLPHLWVDWEISYYDNPNLFWRYIDKVITHWNDFNNDVT